MNEDPTNEVYFAQIREDSRVEREVVDRKRPARIACIGSGGCTAFSILSSDVETVHCLDANPAQCALIELKKAAIATLDRAACLAFLGERPDAGRAVTYRRLATRLPAYARAYWDAREDDIATGVNQCGATERFYRSVRANLRTVVREEIWRELVDCRSIVKQGELFDAHFATDAWQAAIRRFLSKTAHLAFFPAFMFREATEHDFGAFFATQFELEVRSRPCWDNYFFSQLVFGTYLYDAPEGTPHYLSEKGYEATRRNLDRLVVVPARIERFLLEARDIDAFFLSNVFDWMDSGGRALLCDAILRARAPRAVVLYRNMLSSHPLPASFARRFERSEDLSAKASGLERSMMYRRITVGDVS